jgi:hypothetical protein
MRLRSWAAASSLRRWARDMGKRRLLLLSMNPPTAHYEFLGPPGALAVSLLVPVTTYALFFACNEQNACIPAFASDRVVAAVSDPDWWLALWDTEAALIYLGWYVFCILAWAILPGDWVKGTTLRNGEHQSYKINGTTFLFLFFLFFSPTLLSSFLYLSSRSRHRVWHHLQLWAPVFHHSI